MKLIHTGLAMLLCIVMSAPFAARLPSHYPDNFQYIGQVNQVNIDQGTAVIGGRQFILSTDTAVHSPRKASDTIKSLREGQTVGLHYIQSGDDNRTAIEIWIFPSDYKLQQR